jgi:hypothetical protein
MRNIIGISGVPGTGKTTLMWKFIDQYNWIETEPVKLVPALYNAELDLYILGKYEKGEVFAGTDRLSMACQPAVVEFISNNTSNILFEGDRLTNFKFFDFLLSLKETKVNFVVLTTNKNLLKERYDFRGSNQSETFLKGRNTKIDNILANFEYMDYTEVFPNDKFEDQKTILEFIEGKLKK